MPDVVDTESLARALRELEAAKTRVERDAGSVAQETRTALLRPAKVVVGKCQVATPTLSSK